MALFYAATIVPWVDGNVMYPVLGWTARGASVLLRAAGEETSAQGVVVAGRDFKVAVRRGCDPFEPVVLFGAAVIAFPAASRKKLVGLAIGSMILFGINLVRVASLYLAGRSHPAWFECVHQEIWPALFILFSVLLWLAWLAWARRSPETTNA